MQSPLTNSILAARNISLLYGLILFFLLLGSGCKSLERLDRRAHKQLNQFMENSAVFDQGFTGFALYDPDQQRWLYQQHSDKYFTPASNTKILTLFTALQVLGDSLPALRYHDLGDSLLFWGTGDPTLWHPLMPLDSSVQQFLQSREEQLFYCPNNFQDAHYGPAWAWDDYLYTFQTERSALPVYGNTANFKWQAGQHKPAVEPPYFAPLLHKKEVSSKRSRVLRHQDFNHFTYQGHVSKGSFSPRLPFKYSDSLLVNLLSNHLGKDIGILEQEEGEIRQKGTTLYSLPVDTVYRRLMHQSDNFIADQLLLMCSDQLFDTMDSRRITAHVQKELMPGLPDQFNWVDGSGLSRYNLFTPRSIVHVLDLLYKSQPKERLFDIFAAGGRSGTIKKWYASLTKPFIYAKTGTMRNRHCLSGYLITKSGRLLIFSFMHNNYPGSSKVYKEEMEKILGRIHQSY